MRLKMALLALAVLSCEAGESPVTDASTVDVSPPPTACAGAPSEPLTEEDVTRSGAAGTTEVEVLLMSALGDGEADELTFKVKMTNHTCSIPGFSNNLEGMAVVEVGAVSVHEARYEVLSADAHHPVGLLTFPSTVDGASLVPCDAIALRLTISGVDGDPRVFEWTGAPVVAAARP